jgi:hypothetical protein
MLDYNDALNDVDAARELDLELSLTERDLLREVVKSLRTIQYGSIVLTLHDGQLVEINKTVRIRSRAKASSHVRSKG